MTKMKFNKSNEFKPPNSKKNNKKNHFIIFYTNHLGYRALNISQYSDDFQYLSSEKTLITGHNSHLNGWTGWWHSFQDLTKAIRNMGGTYEDRTLD